MNIIISNKFQTLFKSLNIEVIKEINGVYSADEIIRQLDNIYYDRVIFDISALKDNEDLSNFQKLSAVLDMSKVILVIDDTRYFSTQEFVSKIISIGIYNFTKNIDGVKYLLTNPNTYKDVMKYHKVDAAVEQTQVKDSSVQPKKYTTIEDVYASNVLTPAEKEQLVTRMRMQETVRMARLGGENSSYVRRRKTIFRILLSILILPLSAVGFTYAFYFMFFKLGDLINPSSDFGGLVYDAFDDGPIYGALIVLLITIVLMNIIFSIVKARIRTLKTSYSKFSIIPFGFFAVLINFDKYFVNFVENLLVVGVDYEPQDYMLNGIYDDFKIISTLMIIIFYCGLLFQSAKTIEFEQDISHRPLWYERLYIFVIIMSALIPGLYYVFNLYTFVPFLTDFFTKIYETNGLMQIITVIEIIGLIGFIALEIINKIKLKKFASIDDKPMNV